MTAMGAIISDKDIATIIWRSKPKQISQNGNWRIRYGYRDSAGAEHQTTETVATIAKRDRFLAYLDRKIKEGKAPKRVAPLANGSIETVAELLTAYADVAVQKYARGQKDGWSDKTYKGNVGLIQNYIVPQIGNLRVWEVTAADIRNALDRIGMMDRVRGNHKKETAKSDNSRLIYDCKKIISKAFWWAVEQELIEPATNPMLGVRYAPPKSKHRNVIPEALLDAMLDIAEKKDPEMYLLLIIMAMLSSRCGEIYALRWSDYGHDNAGYPIIHVNKTLTTCDKKWIGSARGKGIIEILGNPASTAPDPKRVWALKTTKTGAEDDLAIDYIFITKEVEALLMAHRDRQKSVLQNAPYNMDFIFTQTNGWPIAGVALARFRSLLKDAGCPNPENYDLYCMRHYSVTKKLEISGQNYKSVAQDTKHLEIDTMIRYYDAPEAAVRQQTADALSNFLLRSKSEQLEVDTDADAYTEQLIAAAREISKSNPMFQASLKNLIELAKQTDRGK